DLRDKTIVRFDRTKARKITVVGWAEKTKQVNAVVIEKNKDGNWVSTPVPNGTVIANVPVTSPPITIDPLKVNTFLGVIDGLRADRFAPPGDYGFDPTRRGLVVVIEMDGGAPRVQLNIGAGVRVDPDGKIKDQVPPEQATHFVVWADTAADPSVNPFTIPAGPLKPFKEGPGSFGK